MFKKTAKEYARLVAMATSSAFQGMPVGKPGQTSGANAAEDNAMTASGGAGTDELAERAHKMANADSSQGREILNKLKAVKDQKTALKAAATGVADKGTAVTGSLTALSGAKEELAAIRAQSDVKELQEKYDEAMKEYREQKEMVDKLMESIDVIKEGVDFIIAPEEEAPKVATKLVAKAFTAIGHAALDPDPPKDDDKKAAEKKRHDADIKAFNAKTKTYNAAGMAVGEHVKAAVEAVKHLDAMKSKLTTKLKVLGQKMDAADSTQKGKKHKPGEMGTYETIAVFESQADAFLATASATRQLGERDLKDNGKGAGDKDKPTPSAAKTAANALEEANSLTAYRVEDHMVTTTEDDPELTGAEGGGGMPGRTVEVMRAVVVDVPIRDLWRHRRRGRQRRPDHEGRLARRGRGVPRRAGRLRQGDQAVPEHAREGDGAVLISAMAREPRSLHNCVTDYQSATASAACAT